MATLVLVKITYTGGPLGLHLLDEALRQRGLDPKYDPPPECRSAGEVAVNVVMWLADHGAGHAFDIAVGAAIKEVVDRVHARGGHVDIDVEHDDD
jgi:hypothetical protein